MKQRRTGVALVLLLFAVVLFIVLVRKPPDARIIGTETGLQDRTAAEPQDAATSVTAPADEPERNAVPGPEGPAEVADTNTDKSGSLEVRAFCSETGLPAAGVEVQISTRGRSLVIKRHTDRRGTVVAGPLLPGYYQLRVAGGPIGSSATVKSGSRAIVSVQVKPGVVLGGRVVTKENEPVAKARIWTSLEGDIANGAVSTRSDADGKFSVRGLSKVSKVAIIAEGFLPWGPTDVASLVSDGSSPQELVVILQPGGVPLHGRVVDEHGSAVAGASLSAAVLTKPPRLKVDLRSIATGLLPLDIHRPTYHARTDRDGRFSIVGLVPEVVVLLTVRARGYGLLSSQVKVDGAGHAPSGDGVLLELHRQVVVTGAISHIGTTKVLVRAYHQERAVASCWTDPMGGFRLDGLPQGKILLTAASTNGYGARTELVLRPGQEEIRWNPTLERLGSHR